VVSATQAGLPKDASHLHEGPQSKQRHQRNGFSSAEFGEVDNTFLISEIFSGPLIVGAGALLFDYLGAFTISSRTVKLFKIFP
jgi:hypothetical protein